MIPDTRISLQHLILAVFSSGDDRCPGADGRGSHGFRKGGLFTAIHDHKIPWQRAPHCVHVSNEYIIQIMYMFTLNVFMRLHECTQVFVECRTTCKHSTFYGVTFSKLEDTDVDNHWQILFEYHGGNSQASLFNPKVWKTIFPSPWQQYSFDSRV